LLAVSFFVIKHSSLELAVDADLLNGAKLSDVSDTALTGSRCLQMNWWWFKPLEITLQQQQQHFFNNKEGRYTENNNKWSDGLSICAISDCTFLVA